MCTLTTTTKQRKRDCFMQNQHLKWHPLYTKNNCTIFVHRQVLYLAQHLVVYSTYFYYLACERFIVQLLVIAKPQQTIHFFWSSSNFAHNCNNTLTCHKFAIAKTREKLTIEIKRKQEKNQNYKSFQCKKKREKQLEQKSRSFPKKKVGKNSSDKGVKWKRWHKGEKG